MRNSRWRDRGDDSGGRREGNRLLRIARFVLRHNDGITIPHRENPRFRLTFPPPATINRAAFHPG
jgi:hypothetical protein